MSYQTPVSIEVAKLCREKGMPYELDYGNIYPYYDEELDEVVDFAVFSKIPTNLLYAPQQSYVAKWLREDKDIYVSALPYREKDANMELCWYYTVTQDDEDLLDILLNEVDLGADGDFWDTYEEAMEDGLIKALNLI